jgi:hypothetical protein
MFPINIQPSSQRGGAGLLLIYSIYSIYTQYTRVNNNSLMYMILYLKGVATEKR